MIETDVKTVIWDVFSKDMEADVKPRNIIEKRQKEVRGLIGDFNRNEYRKILNGEIRDAFYRLVDGNETQLDVNFLKSVEFGTKQWSDKSFNAMKAGNLCGNACFYCYIQAIFHQNNQADIHQFYKKYIDQGLQIIGNGDIKGKDRQAFLQEFEIKEENIKKGWAKHGKRYLFMTPTSHDIFQSNMVDLVTAWKKMLDVDHELLIVSKPRIECIKYICKELKDYKDKITFRFTITSDDQEILDVFEPLAPTFDERMTCLEYAREMGFETSVSIEPFLSDPVSTVEHLLPWVTGEIWIGAMNNFPSEKIIGYKFTEREQYQIDRLKNDEYTFENHERIVNTLRNDPNIQWKESFVKMYLKKNSP
jgi:hypothetical protein